MKYTYTFIILGLLSVALIWHVDLYFMFKPDQVKSHLRYQSWQTGNFVAFHYTKAFELKKETLIKTFFHMPVRYLIPGRNISKVKTGYQGKQTKHFMTIEFLQILLMFYLLYMVEEVPTFYMIMSCSIKDLY